jgi:DNA-binding NarL/FixJ family response regulator
METVMLTFAQASSAKLDSSPRGSKHVQAEAGNLLKILVVDDHFLIREALRSILAELGKQVIVMEAKNGCQAMQLISEHADIDLVLLELNLPDQDGLALLSELRERHPTTSAVVFSARQDRESVAKALDLGALGFIPKSGRREIVQSALKLVFAGGIYVPPEILAPEDSLLPKSKPSAAAPSRTRPADLGLTERQIDVLRHMMQGKSNKAICRALKLAEPTVKNHVTSILKAFKVTNRTEAVIAIGDLGWKWPSASSNVHASAGSR